jgi:hypothetical protein
MNAIFAAPGYGDGLGNESMWKRNDHSDPSAPPARSGLVGMGLAVLMALPLTALASHASADPFQTRGFNDARVSASIRPCFGMLLGPEMHTCGYRHEGPRYGYYNSGGIGGGRYDATVDCDRAHPGYVEEVAAHIRDGGVLYLKAHERSCVVSLVINRSITIIGQGYGPNQIPVIVAPDGESCISIKPSAQRVILKDLYISSPRGDDSDCVVSTNSEVTVQGTEIRYQGNQAAIHANGGRLNLIEGSHIIAKTRGFAVTLSKVTLLAEDSEIASTVSGIRADLNGDSDIHGVTLQQLADWHGFDRGNGGKGLDLKLIDGDSIVNLSDLTINFFPDGVLLDGNGEGLLSHSLIRGADHGVTSWLERTRIIENTIIADEIGVEVKQGTTYIGRNEIAGVRTAGLYAAAGKGAIRAVDNKVDPAGRGCEALQWGEIDPAERHCTPWYKNSEFDVPGDAADQYMFDHFWPSTYYQSIAPKPLASADPAAAPAGAAPPPPSAAPGDTGK